MLKTKYIVQYQGQEVDTEALVKQAKVYWKQATGNGNPGHLCKAGRKCCILQH